MNDVIDIIGIKSAIEGISEQISTAINIEKVNKRIDEIPRPNLLDNWHMENPINQQRAPSYTNTGYTIDRWYNVNGTVTLVAGKYINWTTNGASYKRFRQLIENKLCAGKTYTASILARVNESNDSGWNRLRIGLYAGSGIGYEGDYEIHYDLLDKTDDFQVFSYIIKLPRDIEDPTIEILIPQGSDNQLNIDIVAMKLEENDHQTLAYKDADGNWQLYDPIPNRQQEIEKCQRYMIVFPTNSFIGFFRRDTAGLRCQIPTPVMMRSIPKLLGTTLRCVVNQYGGDNVSVTINISNTTADNTSNPNCVVITNSADVSSIAKSAIGYIDVYRADPFIIDANL